MIKPLIQKVIRKTMTIRPSGRSTDFISPSFGFGCVYKKYLVVYLIMIILVKK
jgi:hypothetical protein